MLILVRKYIENKLIKTDLIIQTPQSSLLFIGSRVMGPSCDLSWLCLSVQNPF